MKILLITILGTCGFDITGYQHVAEYNDSAACEVHRKQIIESQQSALCITEKDWQALIKQHYTPGACSSL